MPEMTVKAAPEQLDAVVDFVNGQLAALNCPDRFCFDVNMVVDELLGNIIRYAYGSETGTVTVRVELQEAQPGLILTFLDHGAPFDPLTAEAPDTTSRSVWERPIGGLGLFMVRNLVDEIAYARRDGQNVLTVRKAV